SRPFEAQDVSVLDRLVVDWDERPDPAVRERGAAAPPEPAAAEDASAQLAQRIHDLLPEREPGAGKAGALQVHPVARAVNAQWQAQLEHGGGGECAAEGNRACEEAVAA